MKKNVRDVEAPKIFSRKISYAKKNKFIKNDLDTDITHTTIKMKPT